MILRVLLILMMAIGTAGLVLVGWIVMHPTPKPKPNVIVHSAPPPMVSILVSAKDLEAGTLLVPSMISTQSVLVSNRPPSSLPDTFDNKRTMVGSLLKRTVAAGTPLLLSDVITPQDRGFLAAVLAPGDKAETISINPETGVGGLIWPGDHVDVLLTRTDKQDGIDERCRVSTQLLLSDRRVVAIDRHLTRSLGPGFDETQVRTATLELLPADVPRLTLATHVGEVSLTVRSALSTGASTENETALWDKSRFHCASAAKNTSVQLLWEDDLFPGAPISKETGIRVFAGQSEVRSYPR